MELIDKRMAIQLAQMRQLFAASTISLVSSVLLAAILVYALHHIIARLVLVLWFAMIVVASLSRASLVWASRDTTESVASGAMVWLTRFRWLVGLAAVVWGSAGVLLFAADQPQYQMVLVVVMVGLVSGAIVSFSADLICAATFLLLAVVPLMLRLFVSGGTMSMAIGMALLLYLAFMGANLRRLNRNIYENIKLRLEADAREESIRERVAERTAQLQFANQAKDSFLATMSHEIRTPLGGLLGMMELLGLSQLDAKQREMLQAARKSGKSLQRIVDDILDWSKIEAGKLELAPHPASIREMLQGVANIYTQLTAEKDIQLKVTVAEELSAMHDFDPLRVSQILNNFTSNALKFTECGVVEIRAQRLTAQHGCEEIRFSVQDSGIGIAAAQQARLFQHYEQASADTARMYGGTGLGLAICHRLATLMDGALSVQSTLGVGSTFSLTVTLPVVSSGTRQELLVSAADATDPLANEHFPVAVLIVDDHPLNRLLLKQQLGLLGMQAEAVGEGGEALALWRSKHYDLLITDCHMPEMDGYELTRRIRAAESPGQHVTILAWTANVLAEEEQRCLAAGMDDVLTKPTELSALRTKLAYWLGKAGVLPA